MDGFRGKDVYKRQGHVSGIAAYGMDSDSQRLDHRAMIPGHLFWKYQRLIGIYYKIIAGHSGSLESHDLQYFAVIVHSVRARIALAAYHLWLNGHFVACIAVCHILAPVSYPHLDVYKRQALGTGAGQF